MNEHPSELSSAHHYKERKIVLTPIQQVDGTWVCHYVIIETGPDAESIQQNYVSREAAASAALQLAKSLIDSR
ncbi:MAG: hypothetical protein IPM58_12855 [Nitrospira sp.]|nr:hypothetical protein [Nitrospira sp.]